MAAKPSGTDDVKVRRRKLTDYRPDPKNANAGSEVGQGFIEKSFEKYGAGRSLLADKDGVLIAGNKSQQGAGDAGIEEVIEVTVNGRQVVVVRREDLSLLDDDPENPARLLAYADNRASEISLAWDAAQLLADHKAGVPLEQVFSAEDMKRILGAALQKDGGDAPEARLDQIEQVHEKIGAQPGDLWVIPTQSQLGGEHRLVCGDSTDEATVTYALGSLQPNLCVTDPPYGVAYDPKWREEYRPGPEYALGTVSNDDVVDWSPALRLFPGNVLYVWHAGIYAGEVAASLHIIGFQIRGQIIWRKPSIIMSRGAYHWQHEPCWYAVRKGKPANWQGDRTQSTVWDVASMNSRGKAAEDESTGHSTQKPVEVMRRPILNHTLAGEAIYEPFCGAGTTLVAAELTGRLGVGVEIDPRYVSLTVQRFIDMGLSPRLAERDGKPVEEETSERGESEA